MGKQFEEAKADVLARVEAMGATMTVFSRGQESAKAYLDQLSEEERESLYLEIRDENLKTSQGESAQEWEYRFLLDLLFAATPRQ